MTYKQAILRVVFSVALYGVVLLAFTLLGAGGWSILFTILVTYPLIILSGRWSWAYTYGIWQLRLAMRLQRSAIKRGIRNGFIDVPEGMTTDDLLDKLPSIPSRRVIDQRAKAAMAMSAGRKPAHLFCNHAWDPKITAQPCIVWEDGAHRASEFSKGGFPLRCDCDHNMSTGSDE